LDDPVVADADGDGGKAAASIEIYRIGGKRLMLITLLPSVVSIIILGCLFRMIYK
jgi:hypothetical protein